MSGITHLNSINVQGAVESSTQGKLLGTFDKASSIPAASALSLGQTFLYIGTSGSGFENGKYYTCVQSGSSYSWSSTQISNPSSITVDSALSDSSTNPVQNKVVKAAIDGKVSKDGSKVLSTNDYTNADKAEVAKVAGKQAALSADQMNAVNSGVTSAKITKYDGYEATINSKLDSTTASNTYATKTDLNNAVTAKVSISGPFANTGAISNPQVNVIYLVSNGGSGGNIYDEYIYTSNAFEKIGTTATDLSSYCTKTEADGKYALMTTTVNSKPLSENVTLTAADVGALASGGTAVAATKATQDGSGNVITSTYVAKSSVEATSMTDDSSKIPSSKAVLSAINNIQTVQFTLKVTYSGASDLSGISVTATPTTSGNGAAPVQGTTNSAGVAYLNVRQNVTYKITSSKTNYVFGSEPEKTCAELTTEATISCYVKPKVTVTVTDSSNAGLQSGRTVKMTKTGDTQTATTGSDGKAIFYANTTGEYTFSVTDVPDKATVKEVKKTLAANDDASVELVISFGYGFVAVDIPTGANSALTGTYPDKITVNGQEVNNGCYGFTPAKGAANNFDMGSWAGHRLLEGIKPVSKNGDTWADLGTDATSWAANGASQDYFTEFPFQWLSITTSGSTVRIIFSDSDTRPDDTFQCYAHTKGCDSKSNADIVTACASASRDTIMESNNNEYFANSFHVGCFGANGSASGIYSKKATTYTTNLVYNKFWVGANARGTDYDCVSAQQLTYIQALFLLLYRSKDSQAAHSRGLADESSTNTSNAALATTAYGMAGSTTSARNAFFWIHDLWGNIYQFIGGMWNKAGTLSKLYYWLPRQANSRAFDNNSWNSTSNYAKQTNLGTDLGVSCSNSGGYITQVVGNGLGGFFPKAQGGSTTGGWPDLGGVYYGSSYALFPFAGGYYHSADNAGLFYCGVDFSSAGSYSGYGARLSYRGGRPKA